MPSPSLQRNFRSPRASLGFALCSMPAPSREPGGLETRGAAPCGPAQDEAETPQGRATHLSRLLCALLNDGRPSGRHVASIPARRPSVPRSLPAPAVPRGVTRCPGAADRAPTHFPAAAGRGAAAGPQRAGRQEAAHCSRATAPGREFPAPHGHERRKQRPPSGRPAGPALS